MQINPSHVQQPDLINTSAYVQYAPSHFLGGGDMQSSQSNLHFQFRDEQFVPSQMPKVGNLAFNTSRKRHSICTNPK